MDTGHVKQVAAFEQLLGFCNAHGAMFNPSKEALQPTALSALLTSAQLSLEAVKTARTEHANAVNVRLEAFDSLPKFITRIVNALAATEATKATLDEAYSFVKKFYRPRVKAAVASSEEGEPQATRSISHLDFDSKADNFEALVKVVSHEPYYHPNEIDLQVASLNARVAGLREINSEVINKLVVLSNARATRNKLLFERSGIHGRALAAKRYVKGAFGYQSVAYNQIRSIRFINRKLA